MRCTRTGLDIAIYFSSLDLFLTKNQNGARDARLSACVNYPSKLVGTQGLRENSRTRVFGPQLPENFKSIVQILWSRPGIFGQIPTSLFWERRHLRCKCQWVFLRLYHSHPPEHEDRGKWANKVSHLMSGRTPIPPPEFISELADQITLTPHKFCERISWRLRAFSTVFLVLADKNNLSLRTISPFQEPHCKSLKNSSAPNCPVLCEMHGTCKGFSKILLCLFRRARSHFSIHVNIAEFVGVHWTICVCWCGRVCNQFLGFHLCIGQQTCADLNLPATHRIVQVPWLNCPQSCGVSQRAAVQTPNRSLRPQKTPLYFLL